MRISQPITSHHFLKSKTKEPPKFLSSSGIRCGIFISVCSFTEQQRASFGNLSTLKFRVMEVRDTGLLKIIYFSHDFEPF